MGSVTFTRECRKCGKEKPIENFQVTTAKGARRRECKKCLSEANARFREKHRLDWAWVLRRREAQKRYAQRNVEKRREYQKTYQRMYRKRQRDLRHGRLVDHGTIPDRHE